MARIRIQNLSLNLIKIHRYLLPSQDSNQLAESLIKQQARYKPVSWDQILAWETVTQTEFTSAHISFTCTHSYIDLCLL